MFNDLQPQVYQLKNQRPENVKTKTPSSFRGRQGGGF